MTDAPAAECPKEFLDWWNSNWPNLCPTQIALAAWKQGYDKGYQQGAEEHF